MTDKSKTRMILASGMLIWAAYDAFKPNAKVRWLQVLEDLFWFALILHWPQVKGSLRHLTGSGQR